MAFQLAGKCCLKPLYNAHGHPPKNKSGQGSTAGPPCLAGEDKGRWVSVDPSVLHLLL